jgi:putative FmdB family regulatory protein
MPIYRFECDNCGHEFTKLLPISQAVDTFECENCKKKAKRVLRNVGISFKGSGYYINDSKNTSSKKESKSKEPATT